MAHADLPSDDRLADHTNGDRDALRATSATAPIEASLHGREKILANGDQSRSDGDQTIAYADQTSSDSDQTSSDRDQWAADRDQAASDRDLAHGVDVIGLKALNDSEGHAAGDALLKRVVALITTRLRPYDVVVRLGGDEFLCVLSNMTLGDARSRFEEVGGQLAADDGPGAIRTGFAELRADDGVSELIERADRELTASR